MIEAYKLFVEFASVLDFFVFWDWNLITEVA